MENTKHTPGPWSINEWPSKDSEIYIGAIGTPKIAGVILRDVSISKQQANARLIAAAPDLLAACDLALKALERWHESKAASLYGNDSDKARLAIIEAITKAKGE